MVADSRHREKAFKIEKKLSKSRKNLQSTKYFRVKKKNYEIEKNITESRKKIKIRKNISESRKIFQNRENCSKIKKYFVRRIEKKYLELNVITTFLHNSFIACVRLVTVKSCFAQNVALKLEMNIISVLHVGIKQGLS